MYFNDENHSTNIDKEFDNKNKFNSFKNKYVLITIVLVIVLLMLGVGIILIPKEVETEYFLELNGLEDMTIYQNSVYVDPGYKAYDNKGNDYNSDVIVTGDVNIAVAGEYVIQYSFNDLIKERVVTVIGDISQVTYLNLKGNQIIYLKVGEEYNEPGYIVLDSLEEDLEERVVITGNVNTKEAGTYKLVYSVINATGVTISAERTVIVMDSDINLSYSPTEYTNKEVTIMVNVISNYFDYVVFPDGTKINERISSYKVTENGKYEFKIYDKSGTLQEKNIIINNIDKEAPTGSCIATYNGSKTSISTIANDNIELDSYNYIINGSEKGYITDAKYDYSGNGTSVFVEVKDKAGNVNKIGCTYKNNALSASSSKNNTGSLYNMTVAAQPSTTFPCNLDVTDHNTKLANKVKQYGTKTRAGVVAAATYLTRDLGYRVEYWWAGKYDKVGLNTEWGCPRKEWDESNTTGPFAYGTVHPFGLDCTGFIKWAFVNAGFDADLIPRGDMSYYFGDVLPKEIKFANAGDEINKIKPGDILWKKGHVVLVIAVSDTQLKVAQSVYAGIREDLVDKKTGKQLTHDGQFETFILLEEFFKKYGN